MRQTAGLRPVSWLQAAAAGMQAHPFPLSAISNAATSPKDPDQKCHHRGRLMVADGKVIIIFHTVNFYSKIGNYAEMLGFPRKN
jgi:hypothetical protein